jgi:5'-nucleotidase
MNEKRNILVSNDDGIGAEGIQSLVKELKKFANVFVSAPHKQQSAVGHQKTIYYPLRAFKYFINSEFFGWAVEGTPADAVELGALFLFKDVKFDLVVSGINHGANSAVNIIYSGTVSAATEGTFLNIPSVAVSLANSVNADFSNSAEISAGIIKTLLTNKKIKLTSRTLLNINIPSVPINKIRGIRITRQGKSNWIDDFEVRSDPNGRDYYWLTGKMNMLDKDDDADVIAIQKNYISITPLHYDLTDYEMLKEVRKWKLKM